MVYQIESSMRQEIRMLKRHKKDDLIDHFGCKLLKIGWETSNFENEEEIIEFD